LLKSHRLDVKGFDVGKPHLLFRLGARACAGKIPLEKYIKRHGVWEMLLQYVSVNRSEPFSTTTTRLTKSINKSGNGLLYRLEKQNNEG
jgi:hypothetical protein